MVWDDLEMRSYLAWSAKYAALVGWRSDDVEMSKRFLAWSDYFQAAGYTVAMLEMATPLVLAMTPAPQFAKQHLDALRAQIENIRAVEYRREVALQEEDPRGRCVTCSNTGRVIVPHHMGVRSGEWVPMKVARGGASFYTEAVLCPCPLGRWFGEHSRLARPGQPEQQMMTLATYEQVNPDWREHLEQRTQTLLARGRADGKGDMDDSLRQLLAGLKDRQTA